MPGLILALASCGGGDPGPRPASVVATDAGTPDAAIRDAQIQDARAPNTVPDGGQIDPTGGTGGIGVADAGFFPGIDCTSDAADHPTVLGCTGLYSDWPSRTLSPYVTAYDPGLHLWSDGAQKNRYIYLPKGTKIDTSNMDEWTFPVGTRVWKEFVLGGQKVETRLLWKRAPGRKGWFRTTYQWSADGSTAVELTSGAVLPSGYEIPSADKCVSCHIGRIDNILGFEAIGLSTPQATGETMAKLVSDGLLTNPPAAPFVIPGNPVEVAAIGWLHANCGTACHNPSPSSFAGQTGLFMRLETGQLGSVQATNVYLTAVNQPSNFQTSATSNFLLIAPGDVSRSCIPFRDGYRDTQGENIQMPPFDTHVVDDAGVGAVKAWIQAM